MTPGLARAAARAPAVRKSAWAAPRSPPRHTYQPAALLTRPVQLLWSRPTLLREMRPDARVSPETEGRKKNQTAALESMSASRAGLAWLARDRNQSKGTHGVRKSLLNALPTACL